MLPTRFEDITAQDILTLVNDKHSERKTLEYKEALSLDGKDARAEFLSDVCSFANASGGDILYGISDEREGGNATGLPDKILGLIIQNDSALCNQLEQLVYEGIQPRLPIFLVRVLEMQDGKVVLIRVGKSWLAPHMVSYANRTRFFSRNGVGKMQLDVQQIGAAFANRRGVGERLWAWKADRISKAIANDGPVPMQGARLLFHFIPATALMTDEQPMPRKFDTAKWTQNRLLMSLSSRVTRYNADGLLMVSNETTNGSSYLQVFRDGFLEYGDSYILGVNGRGGFPSKSLEEEIVSTFKQALDLLKSLEVPSPVYVTLTLIGVKGKPLATSYKYLTNSYLSEPFDRDVILCPDVEIQKLEEGHPYPTTLLPIVNAIWQAAGLPDSDNFNGDSWIVTQKQT